MDGFNQAVYSFIKGALSLLPDSPFQYLQSYGNSPVGQWLGYLNWFIPINTFLAITLAWLSGILVYYVIQIILRWAKAIE